MTADDLRPKGTVQVACSHPDCANPPDGGAWYFWVDALDPRLPDGPFLCSAHDPRFIYKVPCVRCGTIQERTFLLKEGCDPPPILCRPCVLIFLPNQPDGLWSEAECALYSDLLAECIRRKESS